jgi:hypothetical protein
LEHINRLAGVGLLCKTLHHDRTFVIHHLNKAVQNLIVKNFKRSRKNRFFVVFHSVTSKWKAGVNMRRWLCHLSPHAIRRPSPSQSCNPTL